MSQSKCFTKLNIGSGDANSHFLQRLLALFDASLASAHSVSNTRALNKRNRMKRVRKESRRYDRPRVSGQHRNFSSEFAWKQ
jgi:hypothetical protein